MKKNNLICRIRGCKPVPLIMGVDPTRVQFCERCGASIIISPEKENNMMIFSNDECRFISPDPE